MGRTGLFPFFHAVFPQKTRGEDVSKMFAQISIDGESSLGDGRRSRSTAQSFFLLRFSDNKMLHERQVAIISDFQKTVEGDSMTKWGVEG